MQGKVLVRWTEEGGVARGAVIPNHRANKLPLEQRQLLFRSKESTGLRCNFTSLPSSL